MLLRAMKHTKNDHCIAVNLKENFVREAAGERSAKLTIVEWKSFGIKLQAHQHFTYGH